MEQKTIITLTMNPALDISTSVGRVETNTKLRCNPPQRHPGGGGINVSRAVHKLGGYSVAVYLCGGKAGEFITDYLRDEGVEISPRLIDGLTRENITIYEEKTGEQYRFGMPGPVLRENEWKNALELVREKCLSAAYLVASGSLPLNVPVDFYARAARIARETDTRMILDTSGAALEAAVKEPIYLVKPNRKELGYISGVQNLHRKTNDELAVLASKVLAEKNIENFALSLGRDGAMLVHSRGVLTLPAPEVEIRSKIGAGDSMTAGIVLSLSRGEDLQRAFVLGVAAGSAAVMTPGTELCRREDTDALFEKLISFANSGNL